MGFEFSLFGVFWSWLSLKSKSDAGFVIGARVNCGFFGIFELLTSFFRESPALGRFQTARGRRLCNSPSADAYQAHKLTGVRLKLSGTVAEICNLLYRRIAFGREFLRQQAQEISSRFRTANPRYSRIQFCATIAVSPDTSIVPT
jgi:hypothetical protein